LTNYLADESFLAKRWNDGQHRLFRGIHLKPHGRRIQPSGEKSDLATILQLLSFLLMIESFAKFRRFPSCNS
jgi:hypothetical protein